MKLAAIYITPHFLFKEAQLINFGSKSLFHFDYKNKTLQFSKSQNEKYITNYYDQIEMISAIVGANGSGKTSILRILNQHSSELDTIFIYEDENANKIYIYNRSQISFKVSNFEFTTLESNDKLYPLFYSPSIDYDLLDIFSPISLTRNFKDSLSDFYFDCLERQLLFLNSEKINLLKDIYPDIPTFNKLNVSVNNFSKSNFLNIYREATLGKSLNKQLELLWSKYNSNSDTIHDGQDFLKNIKIMLLSLLILDDIYVVTNDNGFEIGFDEVMSQNTFTKKLNKFLEKRISNIDAPTYRLLKENYSFDLNNSEELIERIRRSKLTKISGGFEFNSIKTRMINCINAFNAVYIFYSFIRDFNITGRIKKDNRKVFIEFDVNEIEQINLLVHQYEKLLSTFKNSITHNNFRILNFTPDIKLSTGEKALLDLFSILYYFTLDKGDHQRQKENYLLLLDEPELGYHSLWKKKFISAITKVIPVIFNELEKQPKVQVIFSTHDALTLSDIPRYNVVLLDKKKRNGFLFEENLDIKTLGANISDIIADSFFIEDGLIGEFISHKINLTITWLREEKNQMNQDYYRKIIENIDEPIIQRKLAEMFSEKMQNDLAKELILKEITSLTQKYNKL